MATVQLTKEQRFLFYGVDWKEYLGFLKVLKGRRVRATYDRGTLELMTLSEQHERSSSLLGRLIEALTEELGLPLASFGSTTFKRRKRQRGLEPDQCYYITNEAKVRTLDKLDLRRDPPPDLALEVEISRSASRRLGIYAALGIPEVWRFDGLTLHVHQLGSANKYQESNSSLYFPQVPLVELVRFYQMRTFLDENSLLRAFRSWVQQQLAAGWANLHQP